MIADVILKEPPPPSYTPDYTLYNLGGFSKLL